MKKLLVTAIGAAVAFGAYADAFTSLRFKDMATGDTDVAALNGEHSYWSEPEGATNTYKIVEASITCPATIDATPVNALDIKTTFGTPLSVNAVDGGNPTNINDGVYFDSLVKFTVCDSEPDDTKEAYSGAKIMMWLQEQCEGETITGTNLMIRAGYLSAVDGTAVSSVATNYTCGTEIGSNFADEWHRVTIKAIPNITTSNIKVPGFAIYIDGSDADHYTVARCSDAKWNSSFTENFALSYTATALGTAIFPSIDQTSGKKNSISGAGFDGTGNITDIVFTDVAPAFAEDPEEPSAPQAAITIDGTPYSGTINTLADAVEVANGQAAGAVVVITPLVNTTLTEPLEFTGVANITLDFAGFVITNAGEVAAITNSAKTLTVTDSVGNGGIYCTSTGGAFYQTAATFVVEEETVYGSLSITGGNFWGEGVEEMITVAEDYEAETQFISGGAFPSDINDAGKLVDGKAFDEKPDENGLYPVIDAHVTTYYTIGFAYGDPLTTNSSQVAEGALPSEPSAEAVAVEGKGFAGWDDTIVAAAADKVYTAQYTNNIYTITFVIGENSSSQQLEYGSTISSIPNVPVLPGYTGSWDDDPTGDTVTGNKTYTYTYAGKAYTVNTYTNNALYATYSGTYDGAAPTLANPVVGEGQSWDGKWYTENGGETEFSFNPDAVDAQSAYATVTEDEPTPVTPVTPGKNLTPPAGKTATEYAADINGNPAAYIAVPAAAEATSSTYLSLMKAQVSATDSSKVEIVFNKDAEAYVTVTNQVEAAVAAIPVAAAASETQSFNLTAGSATPGLWYSVTSGNSLTGMSSHSTSVQAAADGSVTGLQAPTYPAKGFYRIDVSPTQDYTPAP